MAEEEKDVTVTDWAVALLEDNTRTRPYISRSERRKLLSLLCSKEEEVGEDKKYSVSFKEVGPEFTPFFLDLVADVMSETPSISSLTIERNSRPVIATDFVDQKAWNMRIACVPPKLKFTIRMDDEKKQSQEFQKQTTEFLDNIAMHESLSHFTPWVRQLILELINLGFPEPETCYVIEDELEMRWKTHGILEIVQIDTLRFVITPEVVNLPGDIEVFHFELPEEKEKASSIFLEESVRNIQKYWK